MSLKIRINDDVKSAMKAKEAQRLSALRLITAAIKQREVDERIELGDADVIAILEKMVKQRRESITQYERAARQDLVDVETFELKLLQGYLPQQLSDAEIETEVAAAIAGAGAAGPKDMGKVMGVLRPKLAGRADMSKVSAAVKSRLGG